ncbi:MAG: hypothetical protein JJT78_03930 [Leptospira sp.]|nr:hypothetical protein [Leptospira sp.]
MKHIKNLTLLTILIISMSSLFAQAKPEEPKLPTWKDLTQKEMKSGLKSYAYAKIRMSMKKNISYDTAQEIFYSPCPDVFPKIPGDLPCNLLELDLKNLPTKDPSMEYKEGGLVTIFASSKPTPLMGGSTIILTANQEPDKNSKDKKKPSSRTLSPEDMQVFYNKENTISHYRLGDSVILFSWKKENDSPTLKKMMHLKIDKNLWPINAKEIDFSK